MAEVIKKNLAIADPYLNHRYKKFSSKILLRPFGRLAVPAVASQLGQ
jgi:hypothetical protein